LRLEKAKPFVQWLHWYIYLRIDSGADSCLNALSIETALAGSIMAEETLPKLRRNGRFSVHQNSKPLYDRVPAEDENGKPYADFMLLIPGLNKCHPPEIKQKIAGMQAVLINYSEVVFVDLNMRLNLLWVSFEPRIGLIERIVVDIQQRLPEAKLVSGDFQRSK